MKLPRVDAGVTPYYERGDIRLSALLPFRGAA